LPGSQRDVLALEFLEPRLFDPKRVRPHAQELESELACCVRDARNGCSRALMRHRYRRAGHSRRRGVRHRRVIAGCGYLRVPGGAEPQQRTCKDTQYLLHSHITLSEKLSSKLSPPEGECKTG